MVDKTIAELWLKVYCNDLILSTILRLFDIKEQMALMRVSQRFQYIIRDVIWKSNYNNLVIQKTRTTTFVMGWWRKGPLATTKGAQSGIYDTRDFDEATLYEFLEYQQGNLKALTIKSKHTATEQYEGVVFNFKGNFENLLILQYDDIVLIDDNIKTINERCSNLKELHLHQVDNNLTGRYLDEFENLQRFSIEKCYAVWSYEKLFNIFKSNLKSIQILDISFELKPPHSKVQIDHLVDSLEVLKIQKSCSYDYVFDILSRTSKPFKRLRDLHVVCSSNLKSRHLEVISHKCPGLQRLYITRCWFEIDYMTFPFGLQELYVDNCIIISPDNVWHILTKLRLSVLEISKIDSQKFYKFNFKLNLGGSLKSLKMQPFVSNDGDKEFWLEILENCSYRSFDQVETLTCDGLSAHDEYMQWTSHKFAKLQNLIIEDSELSGKYIHYNRNLKSLSLRYCICVDFLNFLKILQTSKQLTTLSLNNTEFENVWPAEEEQTADEQYSLKLLQIDYDIFTVCHKFWLHLLRSNSCPIDISLRCDFFNSKFDCEYLSLVFEDADILRNLNRFIIEGFFSEASFENRQCFIDILYNPIIRKHVRRIQVSDRQIETTLQPSECLQQITWCLDNYNSHDFNIQLIRKLE